MQHGLQQEAVGRPSVWLMILLLLALLGVSLVHEREPDGFAEMRGAPGQEHGTRAGFGNEFAERPASRPPPESASEEVRTDGGP